MSRMSKATEKDLNELSYAVLAPVFHQPDSSPKKVYLVSFILHLHGQMQVK